MDPTPYDRARALLEGGATAASVVQQLVEAGVERQEAAVVVAAIAGKRPLPLEAMGELNLGLSALGTSVQLSWDADTVMDAQLNLVFGTVAALLGVGTMVLWSMGHTYMALLFPLTALALARISLSRLWVSLARVGLAALLVLWALRRGDPGYVGAATLTFLVGSFYALKGLVILQRIQARLSPPRPGEASPVDPLAAPASDPP